MHLGSASLGVVTSLGTPTPGPQSPLVNHGRPSNQDNDLLYQSGGITSGWLLQYAFHLGHAVALSRQL
jgi:hypothetical protein